MLRGSVDTANVAVSEPQQSATVPEHKPETYPKALRLSFADPPTNIIHIYIYIYIYMVPPPPPVPTSALVPQEHEHQNMGTGGRGSMEIVGFTNIFHDFPETNRGKCWFYQHFQQFP